MSATGWRKRQILDMDNQMLIIKSNVNQYLYAMLGKSELVDLWWDKPNKTFDMKTPDEVYQTGVDGRKQVYDYVRGCSDGYW
jgi:hypothetical protein